MGVLSRPSPTKLARAVMNLGVGVGQGDGKIGRPGKGDKLSVYD
jgi:hypothetical protein